MSETLEAVHCVLNTPKGMTKRQFENWLTEMQEKISACPLEQGSLIEELLTAADFASLTTRGTFNWHVNRLLNSGQFAGLSAAALEIVHGFMQKNKLKTLHLAVMRERHNFIVQKDIDKLDAMLQALPQWQITGDNGQWWQKKNWLSREYYQITRISRGVEYDTEQFIKVVGIFDKSGQQIEPERVYRSIDFTMLL